MDFSRYTKQTMYKQYRYHLIFRSENIFFLYYKCMLNAGNELTLKYILEVDNAIAMSRPLILVCMLNESVRVTLSAMFVRWLFSCSPYSLGLFSGLFIRAYPTATMTHWEYTFGYISYKCHPYSL